MLGGELVARMLANEGVQKVFGIIDGTYFGLYSSLVKHGIELISPRHETCALHMAGAYARVSGKLGVAIASNGPGVANALPGVAVENGEGNRILLITSTRRVGIGYPDRGGTYQYFNQVGVTRPMSKWSGAVASPDRIAEMMKRALRISYRGRPGVVHVDIPENILNAKGRFAAPPVPTSYRRTSPIAPDAHQVAEAARMLDDATLPMIHAGSGIYHARAAERLTQVADLLQSPVLTSWGGRGAIAETNRLAVPMIYMDLCDEVRREADVVLTLGSRIGETDWWGKAPHWRQPASQRHIQVDIDEEVLGLNKPVDLAVLGDVGLFLDHLYETLRDRRDSSRHPHRREAVDRIQTKQKKQRGKYDKLIAAPDTPLTAAHAAGACQELFDDDAYCVFDGGNTAVWGSLFHEVRTPLTTLSTFKFGMLGAGVSQALGAKIAQPHRQVYCLIGDGAMGFNMQEIETAVRNQLAVVYLVCCDKQWGMVKLNQQFALRPLKTMLKKSLDPGETINADFAETRFDKLAESMGAYGQRVGSVEELRPAIRRSIECGRCAVIHLDVDPVRHMWAPGLLGFKKMHQEPRGK